MNWTTMVRRILPALLALVATVLPASDAKAQAFEEVVSWHGSLTLEEPQGVFTVEPRVRLDPQGGFIVTDFDEGEVRFYSKEGALTSRFGERGSQGPQALTGPAAAIALPSGEILVPEVLNGNVSVFTREGELVEEYRTVVAQGTNRLRLLPDGSVLLIGSKTMSPGAHPLLHRFDPKTGTTTASFFPHPVPLGEYGGYLFGIGDVAAADVRGDRIVAVFGLEPVLHVFDTDGQNQESVPLSLPNFEAVPDISGQVDSRQEFEDVTERHSQITDVFWLSEDVILLQYYDSVDFSTGRVQFNLAGVTRSGETLFDLANTPKLFAVDPETGNLFFSHPDHDFPNRWAVGRLTNQYGSASTPAER